MTAQKTEEKVASDDKSSLMHPFPSLSQI
jgi:hypothetical protein